MLTVKWVKCQQDKWCTLRLLNLDPIDTLGVYVIWKPGDRAVRVGQGEVAKRLYEHRNEPKIMRHGQDLLVTWAAVEPAYRGGVELYLAQQYSPLEGERFPEAIPVAVNLPE